MNIRQLGATATLLAVALTATACGPDDTPSTTGTKTTQAAPPPAASSAASAGTAAPKSAGASPAASAFAFAGEAVSPAEEAAFEKASMDVKGCTEYYRTRSVLVVNSTAPGQINGAKKKVTCSPYGRQLDIGPETAFKVAANASIIVFAKSISREYPRYEAKKVAFAEFARANKLCHDFPEPDGRPAGLECGAIFIYTTDASGVITSMHETWEIVD
ncbi:hypothetical protein ACGFX4_08360 [Kitasatospora sp. NPDC048365]|uniref:hypothetical protein n=1 Tax=Kitasatospora sp. NPDC048365 TaxID=3364050 RepID=UPI0037107FA4